MRYMNYRDIICTVWCTIENRDFWTVKKINNTYYKEHVVGIELIMRRIVLKLRTLLYVIQPLLFHSSTISSIHFMQNVFYM